MQCQALSSKVAAPRLASSRRVLPFRSGPRALTVRVRAEDAAAPAAPSTSKQIVLEWSRDTETIRDVFAFGGSTPERVNGRVAMIGFVSVLAPELAKKQAVIDQIGNAWFGVILFSLTITVASILPKLVSGVPLKDLHAAATSDNMKGDGIQQALGLFDTNVELWSGRLAMLGFAGLLAIEAVKAMLLVLGPDQAAAAAAAVAGRYSSANLASSVSSGCLTAGAAQWSV